MNNISHDHYSPRQLIKIESVRPFEIDDRKIVLSISSFDIPGLTSLVLAESSDFGHLGMPRNHHKLIGKEYGVYLTPGTVDMIDLGITSIVRFVVTPDHRN